MNIEITDLDMILNYLETTSLEPHDNYSSEFTYKDQKILYKYIKQLQQENKILKENAENNDKVVDKVNWENMLLKKENKQLNGAIQTYDILLKSNIEENQQLKIQISARETLCEEYEQLINTILNFDFFKEECPLNFSFEDNSKEDEAQNIFYNDEYCENNCNDIYKDCWLKYFKELQELEGSDNNE